MSLKKTKKRRKMSRMRGTGTHGGGARKKRKKSGHHGGGGMSGSGKRADHKKTLITKLYGHGYFGKQGITSKKTEKDKRKRINLEDIEFNLEKYGKKAKDKNAWEINLSGYKILDSSKDYNVKHKLIIKAKEASRSAIEKVQRLGGDILLASSPKNSQTNAGGEIVLTGKENKEENVK